MKLVEVAKKHLKPHQFEVWYQRRIEMIEPEEVARRLSITVASVHQYVWMAERDLADHESEIEDVEEHLAVIITILRNRKVEDVRDTTLQKAAQRLEKENSRP